MNLARARQFPVWDRKREKHDVSIQVTHLSTVSERTLPGVKYSGSNGEGVLIFEGSRWEPSRMGPRRLVVTPDKIREVPPPKQKDYIIGFKGLSPPPKKNTDVHI